MSFLTHQDYVATDGLQEFDVSLEYLDATHIKAKVNGSRMGFEWLTSSRIRLLDPCQDGDSVRIYRDTDIDAPIVDFTPGAVLPANDLNLLAKQAIFRLQEYENSTATNIDDAKIRLGNDLGIVTNAAAVFDELVRTNVLGEDLIDRFNQTVSDQAQTASAIIDNTLRYIDVRDTLADRLWLDGIPLGTVISRVDQESHDRDNAIANSVQVWTARTDDALAVVYDMAQAAVVNGTSTAERVEILSARADQNANAVANALAQIVTERAATANAITGSAANTTITLTANFDSKINNMNVTLLAGIADARNVAATANSVQANAINALFGKVDTGSFTVTGAITNSQNISANAIQVVANATNALATEFRSNAGALASTVQQHTGLIANASTTATTATNIATSIRDGNLAVILNSGTTVAGQTGTLTNILSGINSRFNDANAYVVSQIATATGPGSSVATSIGTLQSTVGSHTSTITQLYETSNGLVNRASLSLVSGSGSSKVVTGWSILNGPNTSQISFLASTFSIVDTIGGVPITVFEVSGGWVRCPKLIAGDIVAGTITADKIVTGAVDGTKIPNNTINNYHISSGAIATATNATSASAVSVATSAISGTTPDLTVQTLTITTKGGAVTILGGFNGFQITTTGTGGNEMNNVGTPPTLWVIRDGVVIYSCALQTPLCGYTGGGGTEGFTHDGVYKASTYHTLNFGEANLPAGTHSYELRVTGIPANIQSGTAGTAYAASNRHLSVFELVRTGT